MKSDPIRATISNVGGITHAELELSPGVNVLRGRNGAGKSSAMAAITRALGAEVPLEVRDGAERGRVEVGGVTLEVRRVVRSTGKAELGLADVAPLGELIDPGIKDPDAANRARIRALLAMVRLPADDDAVRELASNNPEVFEAALQQAPRTLLEAAEAVRLAAHALARKAEARTSELSGARVATDARLDQLRVSHSGGLLEDRKSVEEAEEGARAAKYRLDRIGYLIAQRDHIVASQAKARRELEALSDCATSVAEAEEALRQAAGLIVHAEGEVGALRAELVGAEADLAHARREQAAAAVAVQRARTAEEQRARLRAALDEAAPDVSDAEREAAEQALAAAQAAVTYAHHDETIRQLQEDSEEFERKRREAELAAEHLRLIATTTGDRLGEILSGTNAAPFTLTDGRLAVLEGGQVYDFATRRSDGQRIAAALAVAVRSYPSGIVPLSGRAWTALDGQARTTLAKMARNLNLYVLTEEPDDSPELHCEASA